MIAVRGKGAKERLVPISEPARAAILRYRAALEERMPAAAKGRWLFPADSRSGHLARQAFARELKTKTVEQVVEQVDSYYKENPGKLDTSVLEVILIRFAKGIYPPGLTR